MRFKLALLALIITGGFVSFTITGCGDKEGDSAEEVEVGDNKEEEGEG